MAAGAALFFLRAPPADVPSGLVFVSEGQVHRLLPDGGDERLTSGPRQHFPAAWLGDRLIVVESVGDGDDHVERLLFLDGAELHADARRARSPAVGDGFVIVESSRSGFSDLWLLQLDGGAQQLTQDGEAGSFEPQLSGGEVFFASSRDSDPELYAMPLDGGVARRLTVDPSEDVTPRVRDERVVFVSSRGGSDALYVLPREGGTPKPLHVEPLEPGPKAPEAREDVERDAVFTPDGREVVFAARRGGGRLRLWAVELASGKARALTDGTHDDDQPAVSPDGKRVAFVRGDAARPEVWVMPLQGGKATRVASGWLPRWPPNSENP